jgi:hypothetical protein
MAENPKRQCPNAKKISGSVFLGGFGALGFAASAVMGFLWDLEFGVWDFLGEACANRIK